MAEHRFCKPVVVGSTPTASLGKCGMRNGKGRMSHSACPIGILQASGRWPSGQRHQTVNLTGYPYGGSNPSLPTWKCRSRNAEVRMTERKTAEGKRFHSFCILHSSFCI